MNLLKKIADRDYLVFSQCFFDFTSGGEQNCKIKILYYDLSGNIQKDTEEMDKITDDFHFLLFGGYGYMLCWLAQILESETGRNRNDPAFWEKWGSILNPLFNMNQKYELSNVLSLFDQKTKSIVIEKHATVQFKIHKVYKNSLVRVANIPLDQDIEGQIYLFVILFDFFCKKYVHGHKILGISCDILMNYSLHRGAFPIIGNKIMEVMGKNIENISTLNVTDFYNKIFRG